MASDMDRWIAYLRSADTTFRRLYNTEARALAHKPETTGVLLLNQADNPEIIIEFDADQRFVTAHFAT